MKKIFALAIAVVMALALAVPAFALTELDESPVQISIAKVAAGSVVVDGTKDAAYDASAAIDITEQNLDSWDENPCETSAKIWVIWDGAYVYVYGECVDPEVVTVHEGDPTTSGKIWAGDHLGIMIDWDYNRTIEYEYSYDDNGDNVSYINIAADGGQDFFQPYHLTQEGMPYHALVSTYANYDADAGVIYYEAKLPVPATAVEVSDGMKVGFEVGFTNANSVGLADDEDNPRVGNLTLSPFGSKMYKWTHVLATATLLGEGEAVAPVEPEAPVEEPEAPVEEPEAPVEEPEVEAPIVVAPSNPSTADVSVLFYALASISAVAGLAISKRK